MLFWEEVQCQKSYRLYPKALPKLESFITLRIFRNVSSSQLKKISWAANAHKSVQRTEYYYSQHIHKKRIVQKHGPNWPFYALMLRTKLYQNPFFFTGHQNVNQRVGKQGLFMDSYFYLFIRLLSAFFLFYVKMQIKQDQTVL